MTFCTSSRRSSAELTTRIKRSSLEVLPCCGEQQHSNTSELQHFWRRRPESNRCIVVLQTTALPLGYAAKAVYYILAPKTRQLNEHS